MWSPEDSGLPESLPRRSTSLSWSAILMSCALKKTTPRSETRRARSRSCSSAFGASRIALSCVDGSTGAQRLSDREWDAEGIRFKIDGCAVERYECVRQGEWK